MNMKSLLALVFLFGCGIARADLCPSPVDGHWITCPDGSAAANAAAATPITFTNKDLTSLTNSLNASGITTGNVPLSHMPVQFVACTNGSTGSADAALLTAAAASGGSIILTADCTTNATITLSSSTTVNGNGYNITAAAAANWSGSTISAAFRAANSAIDITIENFANVNWTGAGAGIHAFSFPSGNQNIAVINNTFFPGGGDAVAYTDAADVTTIGNKAYNCTNACFDHWGVVGNVIETGNIASTINTTASSNCYLYTGFNTNDTAGTNANNYTLIGNSCLLNGQASTGQLGMWIEGYATCGGTAHTDHIIIADNRFVIASGIWAEAIRVTGCADDADIHDNLITSDGVTTSSLPAIEINGSGPTHMYVHDNHVTNWKGQTAGSDAGVFKNGGTGGSLINNSCVPISPGVCTSPVDNVGGAGTPQQLGDSEAGDNTYLVTSPTTFSGTLALNGALSGTGLTNYFASPPAIGGSAPAAVAATTLSSTSIPTVNGVPLPNQVFNWGIPVGIPSSGSIGTAGALTLTTALNLTYPNAYLWFPAGAVCATCNSGGASAAGVYYVAMTSATAGTVYFNTLLTSGKPTIPGTLNTTTGPGAYTQSTSAQTLLTLSIPGNSLGPNGSLVFDIPANRPSNGNTVALETFYGGSQTSQFSVVSVVWYGTHRTMRNLGATNFQVFYCATCVGAMTDATTNNNTTSTLAIDSTQAQNFVVKGILTTSALDWIMTLGGTIQANYAP